MDRNDEYVKPFYIFRPEIKCTHMAEDPPMPWEHKMLSAGE